MEIMFFTAAMLASLLDPLRLASAIGCGFIQNRVHALIGSGMFSLGLSAMTTVILTREQATLTVEYWIGSLMSALLLTALINWLRNRKKPPPASCTE